MLFDLIKKTMKYGIRNIAGPACCIALLSIYLLACSDDDDKTATVTTLAGTGAEGHIDGSGATAKFNSPSGVAADAQGNVYVTDFQNCSIRKITASGEVSSLAGKLDPGYIDATGELAKFYGPNGVAVDQDGNLYIADEGNHRIRKVTPAGEVTTFAGSGVMGYADGKGNEAQFHSPSGITIDTDGNLYIADQGNNCIRKITPGKIVTTLAGNGEADYKDGAGDNARFYRPTGVAADVDGNIYVADLFNHRIRKITAAGVVSTVAGTGVMGYANGSADEAKFRYPAGLALDAQGNIYVADSENQCIRKIDKNGTVSTLAGSSEGFGDGALGVALFRYPREIEIDAQGNMYIADAGNNRIRKITNF